jgi:glycosyltransferase involved in cell wall biosynthesis
MKIVHLCAHMDEGGAFRGVWNLHSGLRQEGVDSRILAREQARQVTDGSCWDPDPWGNRRLRKLSLRKIWSNRTPLSNTHFSLDYLGVDVSRHPWVQAADILHLHWVAEYLSSRSLAQLAALNKPIFWTLHDLRPLTGGCHFPAGCGKFRSGCHLCPQLIRNHPPITSHAWQALRRSIALAGVEWIGPSRWICKIAKLAQVGSPSTIHHIPYGVEKPGRPRLSRSQARRFFGLPPGRQLILVAGSHLREKRKGAALAKEILEIARRNKPFPQPALLVVGDDAGSFQPHGWETFSLGRVDHHQMGKVYWAADLLLFASQEENLPFVLLEALSHGLVPLASAVGGVTDLLPRREFSSLLFRPNRPEDGARKLLRLCGSPDFRRRIGRVLILRSEKIGALREQALAHISLYKAGLKRRPLPAQKGAKRHLREGGATSFPFRDFFIRLGRRMNAISPPPDTGIC